ncbi:MAG TPA: SCO family protein [Pelomicrobium sp.]|nr:SCO family protein [Pelomicrobium sp.]
MKATLLPAAVLALAALLPADAANPPAPAVLDTVGVEQRLGAPLPLGAALRDEAGRRVRLGDYFADRPVILVPGYYHCPNLCGSVWLGLQAALRQLPLAAGQDYTVVAVSVDPRETPTAARAWRNRHLPASWTPDSRGWQLLTGDEAAIGAVMRAAGFRYAYDAAQDQYAHAAVVVVATPDGRVSRYLFGVRYGADDLRLALVEAGGGRLGSIADRLLLLCYHYDPATGRYSPMIARLLQLGGGATVLALGAGFVLLRRRERRRGREDRP